MYSPPKEYINNFKSRISKALKDPKTNPIAAFDADGTLWFSDVGRDFYDFQIKHNYFPIGTSYDWEDYKSIESQGMEEGLTWLAKILKTENINELRKKVSLFHEEYPPIYVQEQKEIIKFLKEQNVRVLIVTASVSWTIEAAAREFDIPPEDIVGVRTKIEKGVITDQVLTPISWAEGKVPALLEKTEGKRPFLVSGNTTSDCHMIDIATDMQLVIHGTEAGGLVHESEVKAISMAKEKNWDYIDYINGAISNH